MASALPFLVFFFLLLLPLFPLALSGGTPGSTAAPSLIQKTCNETTYYDLCVSSLGSDPHSRKADVKGLSTIAIDIAISNATNTSSFAAALAHNATDASLVTVLRACATKYANAREALQWSLDALSTEAYDYAFVHVSAAAEYPNVCRVLFRQNPRLAYPAAMARREEDLEHLCTIALEIISLLG
ncbi:unnamed protein product [Musa banksii]